MPKISRGDSLVYNVKNVEIAPGFNAAAGFDGIRPALHLGYEKSNDEGLEINASATATVGRGVSAGASVVQHWEKSFEDGNKLDVRAGAAIDYTSRAGRLDVSAGVRADYIRPNGLSPYFTAIASTRADENLTVGAGVCHDLEITALPKATVCGGVESRGNNTAAAFSINRSF